MSRRLLTISGVATGLAIAACAISLFTSCKSRTLNRAPSRAASDASSVPSPETLLPIPGAADISDEGAAAPTNAPPNTFISQTNFLALRDTLKKSLPSLPQEDWYTLIQRPFAFQRFLESQSALRKPIPFPAATVLKYLREFRSAYWSKAPGLSTEEMERRGSEIEKYLITDVHASTISNWGFVKCLRQYDTAHWTDLQFHYYCALPTLIRACYRSLSPWLDQYAEAGLPRGAEITPFNTRPFARDLCLGYGGTNTPEVDSWIDSKMNLVGGKSEEVAAAISAFKEFYAKQEINTGGSKVNMFDFLMFSDHFAFDQVRQQAVLNVFYADMKGLWEDALFTNETDACKRPKAKLDEVPGVSGTPPDNHCRADKTWNSAVYAYDR